MLEWLHRLALNMLSWSSRGGLGLVGKHLITSVVCQCRAKVPAFDAMWIPRSSFFCFSWIKTFVPGGAIGVSLKSNLPASMLYAETFGFRRDDLTRFNVSVACSMR
jgi:hypothetical protein